MNNNLTLFTHHINASQRERRQGHTGAVIWLTGLSGAGKSTLAMAVEKQLFEAKMNAYVLDGDNLRHGLNSDLGFSAADRTENIRRVGEVAALFADAGIICITSFISPFRADRASARKCQGEGIFCEVYLSAALADCEIRDPKGLYRKARAGLIPEMTGINSPYEAPEAADLVLDTAHLSIEAASAKLFEYIVQRTRYSAASL